ncbi:MAG: ParB N-terminal domain-containing protein [Gammaproteobacteria bacterium]|nr:ParB N-terminal domain-containing protein [Gammaproteobacteria bacterium]
MTDDTIAIMSQDVPVNRERRSIDEIYFLPDNPRVYAAIQDMPDFLNLTLEEKQARIYERMCKESSVEKLIPQIEKDGGLQEPIIVRWDTQQVIEGNSRLTAYHILRKKYPEDERWTTISCLIVSKLTDEQQARLLGQAHLHGKTEWTPHAKALYCYRWVEEEGKTREKLSEISGIPLREITTSKAIIQKMKNNDDKTTSNFSYYDVLVRNRKISDEIEKNKTLKDMLLTGIKEEPKPFTAQQVRDKLPAVIDKPRILKKFIAGDIETLSEAYDLAKISNLQHKLKEAYKRLEYIEPKDLEGLERNDLNASDQIARKIYQQVKRVQGLVKKYLDASSN